MKPFLLFISLAVLLISCDNKTESINDPILIGSQDGVLASFGLSDIEDFINGIDSAKQLLSIHSSDVGSNGISKNWIYKFRSSNISKLYSISYELQGDCISIGIDTSENNQVGGSIITKSWIDSDLALEIAEKNGGGQFRNENSDYKISVSLSEAVVPNSFPVWYIYYISNENLVFWINATNGEIIPNY